MRRYLSECEHFSSTSVPVKPATVQAPYLALTRPPVCWATRQTSVLIDEFIALKLDSLDDVIQVLFSRKITGYIWNVVNPEDYKIFYGLTQRCNEGWKNRRPDAAPAAYRSRCLAVTIPVPRQPLQLLTLPWKADLPRQVCSSPLAPAPAPTRGSRDGNGRCFHTTSQSNE